MSNESPLGRYFRENLRAARTSRGLSLSELSRQLIDAGWKVFHTTTLTRIESGERAVKLDEAAVLAEFVGRELGDMVTAPASTEAVFGVNEAQAAFQEAWGRIVQESAAAARAQADLNARLEALEARIEAGEYEDERQRRFAQETRDNARSALETTLMEAVQQGVRQAAEGR